VMIGPILAEDGLESVHSSAALIDSNVTITVPNEIGPSAFRYD
jgi:hypothetical protein